MILLFFSFELFQSNELNLSLEIDLSSNEMSWRCKFYWFILFINSPLSTCTRGVFLFDLLEILRRTFSDFASCTTYGIVRFKPATNSITQVLIFWLIHFKFPEEMWVGNKSYYFFITTSRFQRLRTMINSSLSVLSISSSSHMVAVLHMKSYYRRFISTNTRDIGYVLNEKNISCI